MGTQRPRTRPSVPDVANGFARVGAHVLPIDCGNSFERRLEANEVPGVDPANFPAVERAFVPAATSPPAAAVEPPNELLAHVLTACPNCFHVCPLFEASIVSFLQIQNDHDADNQNN